MIPQAEYQEIESEFAHDGFLIENEILNGIISDFYVRTDTCRNSNNTEL